MNGIVKIQKESEYTQFKKNLSFNDFNFDYCFEIISDLSEPYEKIISEIDDLKESIEITKEMLRMGNYTFNDDSMKLYGMYNGKELELLKDTEYIMFEHSIDEIEKYIEKNPILQTKKIILELEEELTVKKAKEFEKIFGENTKLIYFVTSENEKPISCREYIDSYSVIDMYVREIKEMDLSTFEEIMYAYDIVRDRVYHMEERNEDKSISRDLSKVILGENIVCLGYANMFKAIVEGLGQKVSVKIYANKKRAHARNAIYLKDDKYDIDGVYYFDTTWDSKKENDNNKFLSSYRYFALTKSLMDIECEEIKESKFNSMRDFSSIIEKCLSKRNEICDIPSKIIDEINEMSLQIRNKKLILNDYKKYTKKELQEIYPRSLYKEPDIDFIKQTTKILTQKYNNPIFADKFIEAYINVRKKQYYKDDEKFEFSKKSLYTTIKNSMWYPSLSLYELLNMTETGVKEKRIDDIIEEQQALKNIEQVRLTKVLQKTLLKGERNGRK